MRLFVLAAAVALVGCAHEEELRPAREPSSGSTFSDATFSTTPPASTYGYANEPAPQGRPRLSQVVTLGQEDYVPLPASPSGAPASGNGVNVTVNNNINVAPSPPVYYGGYYGGYGGYGGGYSVGGAGRGGGGGGGAWRGSGWEGAQRTAAPGHTPAVGGNWSPPPSYGPKQMK